MVETWKFQDDVSSFSSPNAVCSFFLKVCGLKAHLFLDLQDLEFGYCIVKGKLSGVNEHIQLLPLRIQMLLELQSWRLRVKSAA